MISVAYEPVLTKSMLESLEFDDISLKNLTEKNYSLIASRRTCVNCMKDMQWASTHTRDRFVNGHKVPGRTYGFICTCGYRVPYRKNSFFEGSHLPVWQCLLLMYNWFTRMPQDMCAHQLQLNKETVSRWYLKCRQVCQAKLIMDDASEECADGCMGGPGKTVEIDETCIGKLKYHRGEVKAVQVWVLGAVERSTASDSGYKFRCTIVDNRSESTLVPILLKWLKPGTTVMSDCWAAYNKLGLTADKLDSAVRKGTKRGNTAEDPTKSKRQKTTKTEERRVHKLKMKVRDLEEQLKESRAGIWGKLGKLCQPVVDVCTPAVDTLFKLFNRYAWAQQNTADQCSTQPELSKSRKVSEAIKQLYTSIVAKAFTHLPVNHTITFKNKDTGACTNTVEGRWHRLKDNLPCGTKRTMLPSYLCEHMYRCAYVSRKQKYDFGTFLKHVAQVHDPYAVVAAPVMTLDDSQHVEVPGTANVDFL